MQLTNDISLAEKVSPVEQSQGHNREMSEDLPITVIEPRPGWQVIDFRELWHFRELLFFLAWRDVKVRYKQTVLGAAWAVLQPLATMIVFTLFLGRVAGISTADIPYPLFVFTGTLPWTFFANSIASGGLSLVGNQNLITKIYFPRLIVPASSLGAPAVDFTIALGIFALLMVGYGVVPGAFIWLAPLLFLGLGITALGVGTLLSALTVNFRDFRYVIPFGVQLWMFATPCIYMQADRVVGPLGQALLPLNPAYGFIRNFRIAMLGGELDWYALSVSGGVALVFLLAGTFFFRRMERRFADII